MAEKFPIRDVMNDCAEAWNARAEPISPFFAAAQFMAELRRRNLRYDTYLQTVITGGGHTYDTDLDTAQAVERNIANGLQVAELLHSEGTVDLASSAEPAALPHINGWRQDDYMPFWQLVMAKPDFTAMNPNRVAYLEKEFAHKVWERVNFHGLDMAKYRDRSIDKSERLGHYANHANALHEALSTNRVPLHPVWRIIGLLGIEESVGSTAEKFYATNLGVRAFRAVLAQVTPLAPEQLTDQELGKDISQLRKLGVQAFTGAASQQFILVEDRTPTNWNVTHPSK